MRPIAFIFLVLAHFAAFTQPCSVEMLLKVPGNWKGPGLGSVHNVTPENLAKEKAVVGEIQKMISSAYQPYGVNASYSYVFGYGLSGGKNWTADPYEYVIRFPDFTCNPNDNDISKKWINPEPRASIWVTVNEIFRGGFQLYAADLPEDHHTPFGQIDAWPEKRDGYWFRKIRDSGFERSGNRHYQYLITYENKLPFKAFTRKQYLEYKIPIMEKYLADYIKNSAEVDPNFDAASKRVFESNQENIKEVRQRIKDVKDMLAKMSKEELDMGAIINNGPNDEFSGFKKEGEPYAKVLVIPDLSYYKRLPKWVPQFFCIDVGFDTQTEAYRRAVPAVEKTLDFSWFKKMLGSTSIIAAAKTGAELSKQTTPSAPQSQLAIQITAGTKHNATPAYDIYRNKTTKGFKQTPISQLRNAAVKPVVNAQQKAAAMAVNITTTNRQAYLKKILSDIESRLSPEQKNTGKLVLDSAQGNMVMLANTGVFLYLKGLLNEGLWCLAYAAAAEPGNDNIVNNLTGIMINAGAVPRALPLARYLASKYPKNTTVMNNLGQAWYALDEMMKSKQVLDTVMLYAVYHPEANATRGAIAEREGKQEEAANFISKSLKGAYNPDVEEFAKKKGLKIDYSNVLYRKRPFPGEYINPLDFRPPPQCTNVDQAAALEAEWEAWNVQVKKASGKIGANLNASSANYTKMSTDLARNHNAPAVPFGSFFKKAALTYKVFLDEYTALSEEAVNYHQTNYKKEEASIDSAHEKAIVKLLEKYPVGEGQRTNWNSYCLALNAVNNHYLEQKAALNDNFNNRFSEPLRRLSIELMYWSQFLPEPMEMREMKYYGHAGFAVNPLQMHAIFEYPCEKPPKPNKSRDSLDIPEPYCPIAFKFKFTVVKLTGDCSKFEIEVNLAKALLIGIERDFLNRKTTLAFGAGADVEIEAFGQKGDNVGFVEDAIPQLIEFSGAGAGGKVQAFIEIDSKGEVSDIGIRSEASLEGAWTEKGDIKIGGKMGVNSGVQITGSDAVQPVVQYLNGNISN